MRLCFCRRHIAWNGNAAVRFHRRIVAVSLLFIAVPSLASEYTQNWQASKLQPAPLCQRLMSNVIDHR